MVMLCPEVSRQNLRDTTVGSRATKARQEKDINYRECGIRQTGLEVGRYTEIQLYLKTVIKC